MRIHKGTKRIEITNKDKKPTILTITDRRKIIITKNKKNKKTYYSYQLNIPKDFIALMQDANEYGKPEHTPYLMHLLELHKQHYIIKLAPSGINSLMMLLPRYDFSTNILNALVKKADITENQACQVIGIIENEQIRNEAKISEKINKKLGLPTKKGYDIYKVYRNAELKDKKNYQLTLPKKDMAYLQAYDNLIDAIDKINEKIESNNKLVDDEDKKELFKLPVLYSDLFFQQKFNIKYMHVEYELHIRIKADIDDAIIDYIKSDPLNPAGIPSWLETLAIDWDDPAVQKLLGIDAIEKDYDLHQLAMDKPVLDLDNKRIIKE